MKRLTEDEVLKKLAEPNGAEKLANMNVDQDALLETAEGLFIERCAASALLIRLANKKRLLIKMSENAELNSAVFGALKSDTPKLRRNAARLLGLIAPDGAAEALTDALCAEEQRFVRPSIILAIGLTGGEKERELLENYTVPEAKDETEKKHFEEESGAVKAALRSLAPHVEHGFTGLDSEWAIELRCPDMLTHQLETELNDLGFEPYDVRRDSLKVKTQNYAGLFEARCFKEALFVIASGADAELEAIAKKARPFLKKLMESSHTGAAPFRFRTELAIQCENRAELVKGIASAVECQELQNSPSDYEVELRIEGNTRSCRLFAKLFTYKDTRFAYRAESIPASIDPSVAAAVLRLAENYLSVNARVIDPCCGSGTFLIERGLLSPCQSLTGVDIAHHAIDVARRNTALSGVDAKYTVNDILRFVCHRPYDELICNLPFGNRVGTHSSCETLYRGLLNKLPELVKKGGIAILYTMEFTLLKKLIIACGDKVTLLSQHRTEAGGLTPMIFILRVNG